MWGEGVRARVQGVRQVEGIGAWVVDGAGCAYGVHKRESQGLQHALFARMRTRNGGRQNNSRVQAPPAQPISANPSTGAMFSVSGARRAVVR